MNAEAIKRAHAARINVANELRNLDIAAAGREFTAEETQTEERMHGEITRLDSVIAGGLDANSKAAALADAVAGLEDRSGDVAVVNARQEELRSLEAFLTGDAKSASFMPAEVRSALQTDNTGGNTVPDTMYNEIIKAAIERSSVVARLAKVINTAGGGTINIPKRVNVPTAALVAEGGTYGKSDGTFGTAALGAHKYGFISQASTELVQDSAFNVAAEISEMGGDAIATALGAVFLAGDGSAKPEGILNHAVTGSFAAAAAITADEIFDVVHSLTTPYRQNAGFVVNDSTVKMLRKLKDTTDQYIWQPGLVAGAPDRLLGYPVYAEFGMPAATTGLKSMIFGDIGRAMMVRFAQGVQVVRSDEYAFDTDLISWKWSVRADSKIIDDTAVVVWAQA